MAAPQRANRAYRLFGGFVRNLLMGLTKRDWRGLENLPGTEGYLVAGNHLSNIDPVTFAHLLWDSGVAPKFLAKSSLFKAPIVGGLLRRTGQIPVFRGTARAADSLRAAEQALATGDVVVIFPEGTITRDPDYWPIKPKSGIGRLALATRVPVVPIAQWGAQEVLGARSKFPKFFPRKVMRMQVGTPVDLSDLYDRTDTSVAAKEATARIMSQIVTLLEEIRGEQAPDLPFRSAKDQ